MDCHISHAGVFDQRADTVSTTPAPVDGHLNALSFRMLEP